MVRINKKYTQRLQQQQQHSLFSQASWGRLEMKPERNKFKVQAQVYTKTITIFSVKKDSHRKHVIKSFRIWQYPFMYLDWSTEANEYTFDNT